MTSAWQAAISSLSGARFEPAVVNFKDHFSDAPAQYAEFRPSYPQNLFAWLALQCAQHETAWDCATGSGQAAAGLSPHFRQVMATDASAAQIASASGTSNVRFAIAPAENSALAPASIDLITVAQAAHWFDLPAFYAEVLRVLKPGGVIALFGYGRLVLPGDMDAVFLDFYAATLGAYWPPERKLIDDRYRTLAFPFAEISAPDFFIEVEWNLPRLLAYLATWSAVKRYQAATGEDPLPALATRLATGWGNPQQTRSLKWPIFMRAGLLK